MINPFREMIRWQARPGPIAPTPREENTAGLGWGGDRRAVRPFDPDPLNTSLEAGWPTEDKKLPRWMRWSIMAVLTLLAWVFVLAVGFSLGRLGMRLMGHA